MARRLDTGWRDQQLAARHESWGHAFPAAGTPFPMIEYDKGVPVALISYQARHKPLPAGDDAVETHRALGNLFRKSEARLPFFTVIYDVRNWAYSLFPHNGVARDFLETNRWVRMTEAQFAYFLYRLRGRVQPDLSQLGVQFAEDVWLPCDPDPGFAVAEDFPHQLLSARRRNFEPVRQTRAVWRNPCLDIDLIVTDSDSRVALVVDYKAASARVDPKSTNARALGSLYTQYVGLRELSEIPALLVRYTQAAGRWSYQVMPLNGAASRLMAYALGSTGEFDDALTRAIAQPGEWNELTETQWLNVLNCAKHL